jgi:radical SAM protein with 4Fe4S-binding SPASM domain
MKRDDFIAVLKKFRPYQKHLQFLSLQGFGESLLDKGLPGKIYIAKHLGFKGIGFATNCTELNYDRSISLLSAGLDTLICSIDGITKETHESIRVGTKFHTVVSNVISFIDLRDKLKVKCKVIVRFIRQKLNEHEWEAFKEWWEIFLNPDLGDAVISFDIVDCDGRVKDYEYKDVRNGIAVPSVCDQLYQRIIVFSNGDVALCCADENGKFNIGNVFENDPIEIYNSETFTHYRNEMKAGHIANLDLCNTCTIPRSQLLKDKL